MEQTFIMVKPDGVEQAVIGQIISRFEAKGYQLVHASVLTISEELAKKHYEAHKDRDFFDDLVSFITSGPVFPMVWQGENIIEEARELIGATNPKEAKAGTIRADFGTSISNNVIHGSDSKENAIREIDLFFHS
ncbi:Nucleoside diphosphate kinase [Paraliobacillus sp. PM-2]|uniref:nucleoside-diphosphate kinase n=1 Tax=Paraliobacillus sp. PM-2 TaxID=1462524 RepID=UPI00061BA4F2|nr:nucleoside-diphosphate kinase [Paraliobacillus sp. PM-2]CQR46691.1 Nucleoside diphosphate kinase [Paraliobacillus sp. PM-2]